MKSLKLQKTAIEDNVAERFTEIKIGNWPLTLARLNLFDKSYFSGVTGMKGWAEWGEKSIGRKEEREDSVFCKNWEEEMGHSGENVGLREGGW